jgi:hypothetical protein
MLEDRNLLSTFTVDHLADDTVGSGLNGSLRYCIIQAGNGDGIQFGVNGTINIHLIPALPSLTHNISIDGPGAGLVTVAGNITVAAGTTVSISGLTIALIQVNSNGTVTLNNSTVSGYGTGPYAWDGGISNSGTLTLNSSTVSSCSTGLEHHGGGISNSGTLTLNNSTVRDNGNALDDGIAGISNSGALTLNNSTVSGNRAGTGASGIFNTGTLTLNSSTVSGNQSHYDANFFVPANRAGGILNWSGTLTLNNSTVSGNYVFVAFPDDGAYLAGGILNSTGTFTLNNSTISNNVAESFYPYLAPVVGGIVNTGGTVHTRNTIISLNVGPQPDRTDLDGDLGSLGHNLIGSGGSGFDPTDLLNVNPALGPLQDNGGPTKTMALLAGSPALNAGDPTQLGVADQRGVVRSGGVNIGAYQASASAFILTAPDTVTAGVPFDVTVTAVDPFGQVALGYTGPVSFATTDIDPAVVLPTAYTFTAADHGRHTFTGGFTLVTPGQQALTATDTGIGTLTGSLVITVG